MSVARLSWMTEEVSPTEQDTIRSIAEAALDAGGRALVVGGSVRDGLLGRTSRDVDVEVLGLDLNQLESILERFGRTYRVGREFQVLKLKSMDVDFSVPESPDLGFEDAARRRGALVAVEGQPYRHLAFDHA